MTSTNILIPLDGSPEAERAIAYLPLLAKTGHLNVKLLAATQQHDDEVSFLESKEHVRKLRNLLHSYLDEHAQRARTTDIEVSVSVEDGSASEAVLNEARSWPANLILMTTHGRSGVQRWRLGSVADKVVRSSDCNTFIIGPAASEMPPTISEILVPLDGSTLAEQALSIAQSYCDALKAKLHIVRVVTPPAFPDDPFGGGVAYGQLLESYMAAAEDYMEAMRKTHDGATVSCAFGAPAVVLSDYVANNHINLVVMTSHGRGGIIRSALGSVTDRMIGGPAPVLVIRPHQD